MEQLEANARQLAAEMDWLNEVLRARMHVHFEAGMGVAAEAAEAARARPNGADIYSFAAPALEHGSGPYAQFVEHYQLGFEERVMVALCLAPHVRPQALDALFFGNPALNGRGHTEVGGLSGQQHGGFLPTAETVLFVLAGSDIARRLACLPLVDGRHVLVEHGILKLEPAPQGEPSWSGQVRLSQEYADLLVSGYSRPPGLSENFPAKRLRTSETWDDLVLEPGVMQQVQEIRAWIRHGESAMQRFGLSRRVKPGYRALFHGPPGTGKTLTAALLGQAADLDVYRIDLAMVVSKYIGETEKNLGRIFDRAAGKNWILFFDEAESLFSKRTAVNDARDRYANQQVAYLLQRIEEYDGVVILASNLREHIDDAFTRRFDSIIYFPTPDAKAREVLWRRSVPEDVAWESNVDLRALAEERVLSGAAIMNVVRYASLMSEESGKAELRRAHLMRGIQRELKKEGRSA